MLFNQSNRLDIHEISLNSIIETFFLSINMDRHARFRDHPGTKRETQYISHTKLHNQLRTENTSQRRCEIGAIEKKFYFFSIILELR